MRQRPVLGDVPPPRPGVERRRVVEQDVDESPVVEQGNAVEAERTLTRAIAMAEKSLQPDSSPVVVAKTVLGHALLAQGRRNEAMPLLRDNYSALVTTQGEDAVLTRETKM